MQHTLGVGIEKSETKTTVGETVKQQHRVETQRLTLASRDDARRSVTDLNTAVCCFL